MRVQMRINLRNARSFEQVRAKKQTISARSMLLGFGAAALVLAVARCSPLQSSVDKRLLTSASPNSAPLTTTTASGPATLQSTVLDENSFETRFTEHQAAGDLLVLSEDSQDPALKAAFLAFKNSGRADLNLKQAPVANAAIYLEVSLTLEEIYQGELLYDFRTGLKNVSGSIWEISVLPGVPSDVSSTVLNQLEAVAITIHPAPAASPSPSPSPAASPAISAGP